ncbi:hypothetical protein ACHAWO_004509 [Cyclotella atomus]|uniref:EamA domain-containing protein n=1 Tax=Cyclotella atomus TaxID=382360 RepID=A0ABD3NPB7_9STRA
MCQNEGSTWSTKHNISEYRPLLPSPSIDDSYHSFPSPTDSSWTGRLLKLRRNSSESACNANDNDRAPYSVILFGQTIAAALAIGNFSISSLENKQLSGRRKENAINDIETAGENESTHFFPLANIQLQTPWHAYLLLAVLDVEANYLTMLSFKHTSLSSSMLLTSLSVFSTLLFRRCIFGKSTTSYNYKKIIGVFVSVVGACIWIRKDFYQNSHDIISSTGRYTMVGDCLAVASALIYGLNDVLLEYTVKSNNDRIEYLGMIGLFGFLFSFFIQAPIFERDEIADLMHNFSDVDFADVWVLALLFILMMSYFYISVTIFLSVNDATILNLSLQSSPLWAVILTTFVTVGGDVSKFQLPSTVFFVALAMVVFGMCLYEI